MTCINASILHYHTYNCKQNPPPHNLPSSVCTTVREAKLPPCSWWAPVPVKCWALSNLSRSLTWLLSQRHSARQVARVRTNTRMRKPSVSSPASSMCFKMVLASMSRLGFGCFWNFRSCFCTSANTTALVWYHLTPTIKFLLQGGLKIGECFWQGVYPPEIMKSSQYTLIIPHRAIQLTIKAHLKKIKCKRTSEQRQKH